jgi:2-succinyl-6-hydroxy-2,4-cyclohexadiene-1-carboxylate synthase
LVNLWITLIASFYLTRRSQNRPQELAQVLRKLGTGSQSSLWEELSHIQLPIHLIVGALDSKFISINQKILSHCQNATLSVVPDCGHAVHFEQPQVFAELLKAHLTSYPYSSLIALKGEKL